MTKRHGVDERQLPTVSVCERLRAKEYYVDGPLSDAMRHSESETAYWCLLSMQAFGPDGDFCCPETCQRGRECYQG